jgi:membrane protease YdiL (CAAX protease family)
MQTMTPSGDRVPDFGSSRAARLAWWVFVPCLLLVVAVQQGALTLFEEAPAPPTTNAKRVVAEDGTVVRKSELAPPGFDIDSLNIKMMLRFATEPEQAIQALDGFRAAAKTDLQRARLGMAEAIVRSAAGTDQKARDLAMKALDDAAEGPTNATTGEKDESKGVNEDDLLRDMSVARRVYEAGSAKDAGITDFEARLLKERHGFLGELTLSFNDPAKADARREFLSGGGFLIAFSLLFIAGFIGLVVAGVALLVVMLAFKPGIKVLAMESPIAPTPARGGSLPVEIATLFIACFLTMALLLGVARALAPDSPVVGLAGITVPWAITALLLIYPMIRGVSWNDYRRTLGLTSGRGVLREAAWGVLGWVAAFPLLICAVFVSLMLGAIVELLFGSRGEPNMRIPEVLAHADIMSVLMLFALMTLWAPITEELVFRGGLFRQLSPRMVPILAMLLSSVCFTIVHAYPVYMMLPVFTLGTMFAFLRHWRGSLIAPMVAHAMNNALVGVLVLLIFRFFLAE